MIEFEPGDAIRYLPCMHTYHMECIDDWLMRSFTCPSCMEPVDAALLGKKNFEGVNKENNLIGLDLELDKLVECLALSPRFKT